MAREGSTSIPSIITIPHTDIVPLRNVGRIWKVLWSRRGCGWAVRAKVWGYGMEGVGGGGTWLIVKDLKRLGRY